MHESRGVRVHLKTVLSLFHSASSFFFLTPENASFYSYCFCWLISSQSLCEFCRAHHCSAEFLAGPALKYEASASVSLKGIKQAESIVSSLQFQSQAYLHCTPVG